MTKKRNPYVPWFHGDFLRSTAGWTLDERGLYWMLLCAQWENGPLPHDMRRLAAIAGINVSAFRKLWPVVGKRFKAARTGLVNARMAAHRKDFEAYARKCQENGSKGAQKRWQSPANNTKVVSLHRGKEQHSG